MVSCIAASTLGIVVPSSFATASLALFANDLMASSTPTLARHLPFSRISSSVLKTMRVDSGGKSLRIAFVAEVAAERTTSPLSMYNSYRTESDGRRVGAQGAPRTVARDWKAMAALSRS